VLVRLSGRRVQRPDGEIDGLEMIVEDITHRRMLEAQLRQAQKMEAVGQLAGGIAHDFNNLLTAILGYSELVLAVTPAGHSSHADLEEICRAAHQAEALTRQLLAFSRKQVFQPTAVDLNEAVESAERMLGRLIGEHIQLRLKLDPTSGSIYADPTHIEQILMNLAVNARDAMSDGGVLTLETTSIAPADATARALPAADQPWVMLAVSDTGYGMTPEVQARVFEPFFTTKGRGKGTGLGLSTVYGIVLQCGGEIRVTSEVGHGCRFEVFFLQRSRAEKVEPLRAREQVRAGTETVLVVEDEPPVRRFVCRVLRQSGFTVIEAADPAEAMRAATDRKCGMDLLLTDVVMPQMSGPVLADRLRAICPGLRVLYMSGYAGESLSGTGVGEPDKRLLLLKPFEAADLLERVRLALDEAASAAAASAAGATAPRLQTLPIVTFRTPRRPFPAEPGDSHF
jgi:two-component system cell cycle sensor histidine kinase/response regulator CckA